MTYLDEDKQIDDELDWYGQSFYLEQARLLEEMGLRHVGDHSSEELRAQHALVIHLLQEIETGYRNSELRLVSSYWPKTQSMAERYRIFPSQPWHYQVHLERGFPGQIHYSLSDGRGAVIRLPASLTDRLLDDAESFFHSEA